MNAEELVAAAAVYVAKILPTLPKKTQALVKASCEKAGIDLDAAKP